MRRLGVDCIDLYQIHWPDPDDDLEEGWETLARLKDEGKVRWIGVSNFTVAQMRTAAEDRTDHLAAAAVLDPFAGHRAGDPALRAPRTTSA